jgi:hypothetical protein
MSDLLVPILLVLDPNPASYTAPVPHPATPSVLESESFWLFAALMDMYQTHFFRDQKGMHRNLSELRELIRFLDPEFYSILGGTFISYSFMLYFRKPVLKEHRILTIRHPISIVESNRGAECADLLLLLLMASDPLQARIPGGRAAVPGVGRDAIEVPHEAVSHLPGRGRAHPQAQRVHGAGHGFR